jgi:hypothetical protein
MKFTQILIGLVLLTITSCKQTKDKEEAVVEPFQLRQTIYYNGDIVAMEGDEPEYAEAVPGFIDGHAHFSNFSAQAIGAQILPPPDAGAKDIPTLITILKEWNTPENRALTGW